jgi:hypothetical protein
MQIDKIIQKVILETINEKSYPEGLLNIIKRRVSARELETAFQEAQEYIVKLFKDPSHSWHNEGYKRFKEILTSVFMDEIHYSLHSQLPEDVNWYGPIYDNLFQVYGERMEDLYFNVVRGDINESLEDKWNTGNNNGNKYDYQHGYCHYFAYDIIGKIKKRFPNRKVNYLLLLANEVNDSEVEQEYLLHVYIKIDDMLLDSNGLTTMSKAEERMDDWYNRQLRMIPEDYEINMWTEESDEIPQIFFNNKFCNPGRVKKDVETFLSNEIVQRIFRDK